MGPHSIKMSSMVLEMASGVVRAWQPREVREGRNMALVVRRGDSWEKGDDEANGAKERSGFMTTNCMQTIETCSF